jgi:anti-sigma regulatory factor (Ser/Thr protein kinase)
VVSGRRARPGGKPILGGLELACPAEPQAVPLLRQRASAFAVEQGAGPDLVVDVALAVSEAVTNAVKYAYPSDEAGSVRLSTSVEDGWLTLVVSDSGAGFGAGPSDGLGLGLTIIARVCDDLKIVQGGSGTQVLMRFLLRS